MGAFGYRKPEDLPRTIPVFPLGGALLLPRGTLPLNIFEPRYLNMIDDALAGERLIGMIQPTPAGENADKPVLHDVGCLGRITSFSETDDGRYLINLTGVSRFRTARELAAPTPYRQVEADYAAFGEDLMARETDLPIDRERLAESLRRYVESHGFQADWSAVESAPTEALVNALSALCPFLAEEKQALLEARSVPERADTLITLLDIYSAEDDDTPTPMQ
ncbi:MAG: LON peptidase substrate-binding domain-containing protein [Pseudomonadota bacterium]